MTRGRILAIELVFPVTFIALWWWISEDSSSPFFPPLSESFREFREVYIWSHFGEVLYSLSHFLVGFPLGIAVGFSTGTVLGLSERLRTNVSPLTEYFRATPIVALIPLGLIIVGPGATLEIGLIALACNWAVMLNTADGIRGVDPQMIETAEIYGLTHHQRIRKVILPAAMPQVFVGIRVAVGIGVAVMVVSNMFANAYGLGARVVAAQNNFDIKGSWAGIFMIAILGVLITTIYTLVQNRVLAWHHGWRASAGSS